MKGCVGGGGPWQDEAHRGAVLVGSTSSPTTDDRDQEDLRTPEPGQHTHEAEELVRHQGVAGAGERRFGGGVAAQARDASAEGVCPPGARYADTLFRACITDMNHVRVCHATTAVSEPIGVGLTRKVARTQVRIVAGVMRLHGRRAWSIIRTLPLPLSPSRCLLREFCGLAFGTSFYILCARMHADLLFRFPNTQQILRHTLMFVLPWLAPGGPSDTRCAVVVRPYFFECWVVRRRRWRFPSHQMRASAGHVHT